MRPFGAEESMRLERVDDIVDRKAVALHSDAVDARIRADAACHFVQRLANVDLAVIEDLRAHPLRQLETVRIMIDRDHPVGTHDLRRLDGEQTDRAAAPYGHRVPFL